MKTWTSETAFNSMTAEMKLHTALAEIERLSDECKAFDAHVSTQQAEIKRLRAALCLYGEEANYLEQPGQGGKDPSWILVDRGRTARIVLGLNQQSTNKEPKDA